MHGHFWMDVFWCYVWKKADKIFFVVDLLWWCLRGCKYNATRGRPLQFCVIWSKLLFSKTASSNTHYIYHVLCLALKFWCLLVKSERNLLNVHLQRPLVLFILEKIMKMKHSTLYSIWFLLLLKVYNIYTLYI